MKNVFLSPPESAKPWVFWYWLHGAVSKEGITADLEAMKTAGIGGAYLMPIKDTASPSIYPQPSRQLSPHWWEMVKHAMAEAKRTGVHLAMHVSDGFALAGGPWITPEKSMQKVVWTKKHLTGGQTFSDTLSLPQTHESYYRDIAVYAFPSLPGAGISSDVVQPVVTTSKEGIDAQFLTDPANTKTFTSDDSCWIQYSFAQPFTLRSLVIRSRTNSQSNRLLIQTSNDGKTFTPFTRLVPPRHGWQDWDSPYTHAIPEVTAKHFRFIYTREGSEPGAEDLDAAKWRPALRIRGLTLSSEPQIHQYEGKNGEVWRVSPRTTETQLPQAACVPLKNFINLANFLDGKGKLTWKAPAGNWTIVRIGHTSTGHKNETGGGGKGLECDKFDPEAITLQFNKWFGEFYRQGGSLADSVIKIFHVDSWECGSQNWSKNFRNEFRKRRGYDLLPYLPVLAGIPVESTEVSEGVLYDVRRTIAELVNDTFYGTLQGLAQKKGVQFSAESVAPTMVSDGMLHYSKVDLPMGEFWLRSPTHDKPNDMLDAISGAHVYGKNIVQAEAFTELRMQWDEHPGMLKALADRSFAMGINKLVYHVFMHNPWMTRKPGITLDAIGLLFQRDQTWWPQAKAWVAYAKRCQALLQLGKPVTDLAVFTGEELPRRSLLPDRLISAIPGVLGKEAVQREKKRLQNKGQPMRVEPAGVNHVANTLNAQDWNDPLRGYAYDSFNPDALLRLSSVKRGRIQLSTGGSYAALLFPGAHHLAPDSGRMSAEVAQKIKSLAAAGATIMLHEEAEQPFGQEVKKQKPQAVLQPTQAATHVFTKKGNLLLLQVGKGRIIKGYTKEENFRAIGIDEDVIAMDRRGKRTDSLLWTHRMGNGFDIYFFSNQTSVQKSIKLSLRVNGKIPELYDPVLGAVQTAKSWKIEQGRTTLPVKLEPYGSLFIVLQQSTQKRGGNEESNGVETRPVKLIDGPWKVQFDTAFGGPATPVVLNQLTDWKEHPDSSVRYYSGTAVYENHFHWKKTAKTGERIWLNIGKVANLAEVFVNSVSCGVAWTAPYRVDITKAIKAGENSLRLQVVNTWNNRLVGDSRLVPERRVVYTVYPFKMEGKPLLQAGLLGPVRLEVSK